MKPIWLFLYFILQLAHALIPIKLTILGFMLHTWAPHCYALRALHSYMIINNSPLFTSMSKLILININKMDMKRHMLIFLFHIHAGGKGKRWNSYKDRIYVVVRLQLWGSTMAPWHWCNIMNFKNPYCWSSHIRSNNGPANPLEIPKAFRNPMLVLMMAICFRNVISTSKVSQ